MSDQNKTHYRKVFNSPYLSSADIAEPTVLTIARVTQEVDKTKKTKDVFNTAYFTDKELRPGEPLKPMILNATNSKTIKGFAKSPFIEDWCNIPVTVYVDQSVRFGRDTVEGLRIATERPRMVREELTKDHPRWARAVESVKKSGNLDAVLKSMAISEENQILLREEAGING